MPEGKTVLATPPQRPEPPGAGQWVMLLLPLLSSISMAAFMISSGRPWMILLGISFVVLSVAITIGVRMHLRSGRRRTQGKQRQKYLEYLSDIRKDAMRAAALQRLASAWRHPHPDRLWAIATRRRRVWERRPDDSDFLLLRVGTGRTPLAAPLSMPRQTDPTAEIDTAAQQSAADLVESLNTVDGQPAWIDLQKSGVVSLLGPAERTREVAQNLLVQLAVLHAPDDVRVAVLTGGNPAWDWTKWLPHAQDPYTEATARDQEVVPLVAADISGLQEHLQETLDRALTARAERAGRMLPGRADGPQQQFVLVLDGYDPAASWARTSLVGDLLAQAGRDLGIHVVCLVAEERDEPGRVDVRVRADGRGGLALEGRDAALYSAVRDGVADETQPAVRENAVRALSPLRLTGERDQVLSENVSLSAMLGIEDVGSLRTSQSRRAPGDKDLLRVPVGIDGTGEPLELDLKESAQGGIGPHGLVVGATGSGKSELLRTLVTGLSIVHSPDHLAFVLVDFKGGATFAGVTELPHVSGLITNLADDLALVDRMAAALTGEQQRRQRMLRDAGDIDSVREYQLKQAAGGTDIHGNLLEPLPYLLIVVDEFGELLSQRQDFIELFVQIGRVGRSLGMHLLLATQRLEEGRLRGLESHLSYRICLRTFSSSESRAVIGTSDAYMLPAIPGSAYLKVDESVYERFRVAHVSGPYQQSEAAEAEEEALAPVSYAVQGDLPPLPKDADESGPAKEWTEDDETELQVAVRNMLTEDAPGHQVWLPPLPPRFTLAPLLGDPQPDADRGLSAEHWPGTGRLRFPVGVVDVPVRQEQQPLVIDLTDRHAHLALVGAPQSGKSTFLRTAMLSAMLTHTPDEVQFYGIDLGGGSLHELEEAPHVVGVAGRRDEERVRRVLAEVGHVVSSRERMFRELRIQSAAEFRARREAGELPEGVRAADIVLAVDNWGALHASDDTITPTVTDLASRGLGVGVHVWLTANRWMEIRAGLRDNIPGRLELRLNDPSESEISRPAARALGQTPPGRGLTSPGLLHHIALPRVDGVDSTDGLPEAQAALVSRIADSWKLPAAPALRILPDRLTTRELAAAMATPSSPTDRWEGHGQGLSEGEVPIGLRESDLRPIGLDMTRGQPHFLVFGDSETGKTSFLRAWMRGLAARHTSREVRFMVVDYRRSLLDVVPDEYIGAQGGDSDLVAQQAAALADKLRERTPPPGITARRLRERDWWEGPELYVVVDDYDLVGGSGMNRGPLAGLAEFVTQAGDLGLHLVLARRVAGAGRSLMSDPLMGRLRELSADGLLLSGDHREGALIGDHRAHQHPPGRGLLVRRRRQAALVQVALDDEAEGTHGVQEGAEL
ncbi:type VII secretion protein EccCa [Streptomyces oryzae]|nr:type VII secretion protein EccCa [Streptomyces oryzae]